MNKIVTNFLLEGGISILEMQLRPPGFTYSAFVPLTKNKERIKKFVGTRKLRYIYQNELDKACFRRDMAYVGFKDLNRITYHLMLLKIQIMNLLQW